LPYEIEKKSGGMTALAGLPLYLELAYVMGLRLMISEYVRERRGDRGWTDDQMIVALVLLTLVIVHRDISDRGEREEIQEIDAEHAKTWPSRLVAAEGGAVLDSQVQAVETGSEPGSKGPLSGLVKLT
jgi:hypothetical protein